ATQARGVRDLRLSVTSVSGSTQASAAVLVVVEDITDTRPERRRPDADAQFLGMVAHELRSPLGAIAGSLHLMGQRARGDHVATRARIIAERQVRYQARLLADLLDASRLRVGKLDLRPEGVDLAELLRDVVDSARMSA